MKAFLAVSCLLAVATAQYQHGYHGQNAGPTGGYQGPLHIPVLTPNGVPQEPAAVVQARNAHLANFNGITPSSHYDDQSQYNEPQHQYQQYNQPQYQPQYQHQAYQAPQHYQQQPQAVLGPNGVPQDAPDVAAAKAAHFAAFAEANARNVPQGGQYAPQQHYNAAPQYNPAPQYNHGAPGPVDTPEVAAAKAAHFAAHAQLATAPAAPQHY